MLSQKAWGIIFVVILGQVLNALSHRILNVAAPTLASSLATNLDGIVWVINAYQIAVTGLLLVFGRIADSIGRGRTYVIGLIVFTLGSALSAASSDLTQLIIFRVLQGVGGSMMSAAGLAVLAEFFPESQRGRVLSISLVAYQVGAFLGPSAGGFLIEYFPWQSIFLLNVVMGTPAIILGMKYFGAGSRGPRPVVRIDFFGAAMLLTVMASLTYGLEISSTSPTTIGYVMLVVPVLSALILVGFERKIKEPSLDMKLFKVPDRKSVV